MTEPITTVVSAQYEHCQKVYKELEVDAALENIKVNEEDEGQDLLVWTGALTRVFQRLELATPYYTTVMDHLKRMGCVEQYRRGGGSTPSKWILHGEPTTELFTTALSTGKGATPKKRLDALEQKVTDLTRMVLTLARAQGVKF